MKKTLFLSDSEPEAVNALKKLSYNVITTEANVQLDKAICTHADCALFTPDSIHYFTEQGNCNKIVNYFTIGETPNSEKEVIQVTGIKTPYPHDVKLNCKQFSKYILCNTKTVCDEIKLFAQNNGYELLHCSQGYAACSTVKLNDSAAITDDESVYGSLSSAGIDCIKVSKGSVKLKGFDYGFIGGCCGLIEKNLIAFTGRLESHTDYKKIKSFLSKYNTEYINLTDMELTDIGGIIPLY